MKLNQTTAFPSRYAAGSVWGILLCLLLFAGGVKAQSGTNMWDAINAGSFSSCGGTPYYTNGNNEYYNGTYYSDNYGRPSPDVWYSFTVTSYADVEVSLCGSSYDTYLFLLDENGYEVSSNDDDYEFCYSTSSYLMNYSLSPGTYYVVVDGYLDTDVGDYNLSVIGMNTGSSSPGANMWSAISAGTFNSTGSFSHSLNNSDACLGDDIGQPNNDIYYSFTLTSAATVKLSHCGSSFDTYMHLLNSSGGIITIDDDGAACYSISPYIEVNLSAGTYYVVSEGYGTNTGDITTNIEVEMFAITYSVGPHELQVGVAMTPINPVVTGTLPTFDTQITSTVAGNGSLGFVNGTGSAARFNYPTYSTFDASGNMYVADFFNNSIRKISPLGVVTTLAGNGTHGYQNGTGSGASFRYPSGVAVDAVGNVYVTDRDNHRIRKITPAGVVSTFAGSGSVGSVNGTGTAASFNVPTGITIDQAGNLYVSDYSGHRIRKITPAGVVSTYAGTGSVGFTNGPAASSTFYRPHGLDMDDAGNLYVADRDNYAIRKISNTGIVTTLAGNGTSGYVNGTGSAARFGWPNAVAVDAGGNVYVADQTNHMIRKVTPSGVVSTLAGNVSAGLANGMGSVVRFNNPYGVSTDSKGNVYVSDYYNHVIRKIVQEPFTVSPVLPSGLVLNQTTGVISGTPTSVTASTVYTITGYNAAPSTITISVIVGNCQEPSIDQNYIITYTPRKEIKTEAELNIDKCDPIKVQTGIQYFDGLGRPLQSVQVKGNPGVNMDIVNPIAYDQYGRETKKYLSYASSSNNGSYKADALSAGAGVFDFYNPTNSSGSQLANGSPRTPYPFAETKYESSPLNRIEEQGAPGESWQLSQGHTQKIEYSTNSTAEVKLWNVTANGATGNTAYAAGQLYKTISKDENRQVADGKAGTSEEFKDKEGKVVLKRIWETTTKSLSTYYVYDDFGNLRYVLPPAVNENGQSTIASFTEAEAVFLNFIYGYHYDGRNRLVEKKIPGKGWEYMIYNKLDQLILSQDAIQAAANKWVFTKYDGLGRPVISGLYTDVTHTTRASQQTRVDAETNPADSKPLWESKTTTGIGTGYTDAAYPRGSTSYLTINYYDDYTFPGNPFTGDHLEESNMTRSLKTGMKVYRTDGTNALYTTMYYDNKGMQVQVKSENHLLGTDVVNNSYNKITGELTSSTRTHVAYNQTTTIATNYTYDHMGRKLNTQQSINGASPTTLSQNSYNEVGQLKTKGLHNNLQATAYTYNERGWLKSNTSAQFSMELKYEDAMNGVLPQYNGNIANQFYTNGSSSTFNYSYDKLNRLTRGEISPTVMSEALTYDVMGNITSLNRNSGGANSYTYKNGTSNQLQSVANVTVSNYEFDANGNATKDGRNNMAITYNFLNLPTSATKTGMVLNYVYDATGNKLSKTVTQNGNTTTRHYLNGIEYNGATIDFIQTEEGIASNNGGSYTYHYNLTDHLGNVRYTFDVYNGGIRPLQREDYYAFGKKSTSMAGTNHYLYNGKELQEELGEQYDYGARFYDPVIARWNVLDPKAELLEMSSPYVYSLNSPTNFVDKDGELPIYINGNTEFDSERGDRSYWDAQLLRTIASSGIPNPGGQILYVDGNRGRQAINGRHYVSKDRALGATDRFLGGQMEAKKDFNKILSMLERDPKTKKVIEKIQIYTHSRGGAFGAGYTDALLELIKNNADQFANPNNVIDYVLNLATHQSNSIDASDGLNSFSIDHTWDMLSGNDMGNNTGFRTSTEAGNLKNSHRNKTFTNEVGAFIKAFQKSKGNNSKLIDDFVNQMRSYGIKVTVN